MTKNFRVTPEFDSAGVRREAPFEFSFEGEAITAYPGETIGGALMAAGYTTLRTTRQQGKPRGIFCGIGICFDCLVVVDGKPNRQACLIAAQPGMVVRLQVGTAEETFEMMKDEDFS